MTSQEVFATLIRLRVVPVVRLSNAELAMRCCEWLIEAGFTALEVTMTIPGGLDVLRAFAGRPGVVVGGGTVLTAAQARSCIDAGARFIVSPAVEPEVARVCRAHDVVCLLGAMTPTELRAAVAAGADGVKIFPASAVGGPAYLRALKSVFPDVALVPTGGVSAATAADFLAAGAAFLGVGGNLVDEAAVARGDREAVLAAARQVLAAVDPQIRRSA